MATSKEKREAFKINHVLPAIISSVKKDRILFEITRLINTKEGTHTVTETAAFFIKGHGFNPYQTFRKGQSVPVIVNKICKPPKNYYGLTYLVTPQNLPIDEYIAQHPVGSRVSGTIITINGPIMTVRLDNNVQVITKRCRHAGTGNRIDCKIDSFRRQKIALRVLS